MGDTEYICNTLRGCRTQAQIEAERRRQQHRDRQRYALERNRRIRQNSQNCDKHERETRRDQSGITE